MLSYYMEKEKLMMENMGCFFHILSKHYICGYYGQVYVGRYFSFVTVSLHGKVLSWIAWRERNGHWFAFLLYNPHFFLEILDQECALFNFLEKNVNFKLKSWHVPCTYFPPFEEVVYLLFRWTLYKTWSWIVMEENSCIKLSFIILAGFAQAFMYSLGA